MNSFLAMHGIESWKPVITALILPPVPFLLLTLIGARLLLPRRGLGWLVILVSVVLLWLSACTGVARTLSQFFLPTPAALSFDRARELRTEATTKKSLAIVILGGGVEPFAPEYGVSSLSDTSLERLRYGIWLAGQTGAPVAFSGGIGWGQSGTTTEARVAGKIAAEEFGRPIKWLESESRDTRENAARTIEMLKPAGINHIVLVTNGYPHGAGSRAPSAMRRRVRSRSSQRRWAWHGATTWRLSTGCRARAAFATRVRCCANSPAASPAPEPLLRPTTGWPGAARSPSTTVAATTAPSSTIATTARCGC